MSKFISTPANGNPGAGAPSSVFEDGNSRPSLPAPVYPERSEGPVFDDPAHHLRLYQGDCLEILAAIPENSVDLVFADLSAAGGPDLLPLQRRHHLPRRQNG